MTSNIDTKKLYNWCKIPTGELENHPESKVKIKIFDVSRAAMEYVGSMLADEVINNNLENKPTRWILPTGPMDEYTYFIKRVNEERISLKNLFVFHMDEYLDWQGRPFPLEHHFSLEGIMMREFYAKIDPDLIVPINQRFWPRINDIDGLDKAIEEVGGVDTVLAGLGYKGLIAFCESPRSPWTTISIDEYRNSKTRIVTINDDTIISLSERETGGLTHIIPPMAITIGFKSLLNTKKVVFLSTTGSWKRTAIRVMMFSDPTLEYPATLIPAYVHDVTIITDKNTASPPINTME
ncbi:MAG TPA: hypothetical protein PKZ26_02800 [Anaerolineaceae bacterium]|nr:hypothetical protein [Anaerolineaceae bacterium]